MANYNGAAFIADAIGSACRQSLGDIEIIVSDDASTDISVEIVSNLMSRDPRIRLVKSDRNGGPAAARNRALAVAKGQWIAVLDNDDLMHPERLATLIEAAAKDGADIVADDLLFFDSDHVDQPRTLLHGRLARAAFWLDIERFVRTNVLFGRGLALGYLKPIFRSSLLIASGVNYDERLRIAEDFYFVFRLLQFGARYRVYPSLMYFYRRHSGSISHRLTQQAIEAIRNVDRETRESVGDIEPRLASAMDARTRSIDTAFAFNQLVDAIKRRDIFEVVCIAVKHPHAGALLRLPIAERLKRLARIAPIQVGPHSRQICVLARGLTEDRTNDSSNHLLELVRALAQRGMEIHFVSPSPKTLGQWPYLALGEATSLFRTVRVRGTWRISQSLIAIEPWKFLRRTKKILSKGGSIIRPASQSLLAAVSCERVRQRQLFIAKHVPKVGDIIIVDSYMAAGLPYALRPDAKIAIVMSDPLSKPFEAEQSSDLGTLVDAAECAALSRADAVVAVNDEAAEFLRTRIPQTTIIAAPMPVVDEPQLGTGDKVLCVGGATAADADGILWFLNECWPYIREQRSDTICYIAASIYEALRVRVDDVQPFNSTRSLEAAYAIAGVVIAPQRVSIGNRATLLKILARGKAAVVTPGAARELGEPFKGAVRVENNPAAFASAVVELLGHENSRKMLGKHALFLLKERSSARTFFGEFFESDECDANVDISQESVCQAPYVAIQESRAPYSELEKLQDLPCAGRVKVVVCICTFRRLSVLTAIESVVAQVLPDYVDLHIVVVDNDLTPAAEKRIKELSGKVNTSIEYIHAPAENISIARNAGLDAAAKSDWLAFLDDDEFASYSWISNLLEVRDGASAIFGPCKALYNERAPLWIKRGDYHSCLLDGASGKPLITGHTSNALVDMNFVRETGLRFEVALGNTGGEDSLFFRTMHQRGGRLKFASLAMVFEDVAGSRLNLNWIVKRKYRAGQTHAMMLQRFNPTDYWRLPWIATCKVGFCAVLSVLNAFRPVRLMWWLMRGTYHLGALGFYLGAELHQEYRSGVDLSGK